MDSYRRRKYGLTSEQYNQRLLIQGNMCAICGDSFKNSRTTHLDHNHTTGQLRSFLCGDCNKGIGCLKENPERLMKAIDYLTKWKS